jgi:hypothetical protein
MLYKLKIAPDILESLNDFYETNIIHNKNKKDILNIKCNLTEKMNEICINLFQKYFMNVNPKKYLVECWNYKCNHKKLKSFLAEHEDDFGGINCKVNTIIFYLRKDPTIIGGDLKVNIKGNVNIIPIVEGDIIIMKGNILHQPTTLEGFGQRNCIVVQMERLD